MSHREKGRGGFLAATGSFRLSGLVPREEERSLGERNVVPHALCVYTQPLSQAAIAVLDDLAHCNLSVHHRSRCCGVRWSDRLRQQKGSMPVV